MTDANALLMIHIATARDMSRRMSIEGNHEWAIKWHNIAETLFQSWKPSGEPNGHR